MRSTVPITIGDKETYDGYATIKYNNFLQSFLIIFRQKDAEGNFAVIGKSTAKNLGEALGEAIDWVEEHHQIVVYGKSDEARHGKIS